jgi:hypothetical protein
VRAVKQERPAVRTERDKRLRILRATVRRVVEELNDADLSYISNSRHGLLVELVERSRDRLGGALEKPAVRTERSQTEVIP